MSIKKKITLVAVFLLVVFAFSIFAQACEDSGECIEGYCYKGECINPEVADKIIGLPCSNTSDCIEGYCVQELGRCIIPMAGEKIINIGFKSGCTGIVTCPEDNILCFILCNLIWVFLIILSIFAAYVSRQRKNKIIPIAALLLPIFVALISIPFAGIVVVIIELILLMYQRQKEKEELLPEEVIEAEEEEAAEYLPPLRKKPHVKESEEV